MPSIWYCPVGAALSEIQWSAPDKKNYEDFLKRLPGLVDVYDVYKYNYATHVFDVNAVFTPNPQDGTLDVTCPLLIIVRFITRWMVVNRPQHRHSIQNL